MRGIYLLNYSVKGIKTLDQLVSLSFYKKTITKNMDTQDYNVKGIYGMNGSGKSGIVTSVEILKNILVNPEYLNNPIIQKNLDEIINKKIKELFIEVDFIINLKMKLYNYNYCFKLSKNKMGKYVLSYEKLSFKKATSKSNNLELLFEIKDGKISNILREKNKVFLNTFLETTVNLLDNSSMCSLFLKNILLSNIDTNEQFYDKVFWGLLSLFSLGESIYVHLDQSDDHRKYIFQNTLLYLDEKNTNNNDKYLLFDHFAELDKNRLDIINVTENYIDKEQFSKFELTVKSLYKFLKIFKSNLKTIEIDKKEDNDFYICNLVMVYDSYRINAEFESTGIKKLIKLYAYIREVVCGGIVFIDELDSNLHDVYLCALLEYLMEYAEGQLCFTTHNVGPMDILKQNKKSIDFLSIDGTIYPWKSNGNYSPSKLYRNGMIEGSPFNVDSIDFIGVFEEPEEEE